MGFENRVLISRKALKELMGIPEEEKEKLLKTGYLSWPSFHLPISMFRSSGVTRMFTVSAW